MSWRSHFQETGQEANQRRARNALVRAKTALPRDILVHFQLHADANIWVTSGIGH